MLTFVLVSLEFFGLVNEEKQSVCILKNARKGVFKVEAVTTYMILYVIKGDGWCRSSWFPPWQSRASATHMGLSTRRIERTVDRSIFGMIE